MRYPALLVLAAFLLPLVFVAAVDGAESEETRVIRNETRVYTRTLTPLVCEQEEIRVTIWRELRSYNVTKTDVFGRLKTRFYSTFTVNVQNNQNVSLKNFLLKERLPESVARKPGDLFNFTVMPYQLETGSVVVTWLFDNIEPNETKSVSYTVEKELGEEVLDEFEAPQVVAAGAGLLETQQVEGAPEGAAQAGPAQAETPFDWTPVILVGLMVVVGAVIFFFARKTR